VTAELTAEARLIGSGRPYEPVDVTVDIDSLNVAALEQNQQTVTTGDDGTARTTFTAQEPGERTRLNATVTNRAGTEFDIAFDNQPLIEVFGTSEIVGQVDNEEQQPLNRGQADVTLQVRDPTSPTGFSDVERPDNPKAIVEGGRYTFTDVERNRDYRLVAEAEDGTTGMALIYDLPPATTTRDIVVAGTGPPGSSEIIGQVVNEEQQPLNRGQADVTLQVRDSTSPTGFSDVERPDNPKAIDDDGRFTFINVESNRDYRLVAEAEDGTTGTALINDLAPGTTTRDIVIVGFDPGPASPTIQFQPTSSTLGPDDTRQVEVRLTGVDVGVDSYDFDVRTSDSEVVRIADVTAGGSPTVDASGVELRGREATVRAAGSQITGAGPHTLGVVTVAAQSTGSADLSVQVTEIFDQSGRSLLPVTTADAAVQVEPARGPVLLDDPATDPDGDGVYEDVNGDGSVSILDVADLLATFDGSTAQANVDAFDFSGDGSLSIIDVATLLDQL
jgi:hypothetical protein